MSDELPACSYCLRDGAEFRDLDGDALCADCSAGPVECTCITWRANGYELARAFPPQSPDPDCPHHSEYPLEGTPLSDREPDHADVPPGAARPSRSNHD